MDATTDKRYAFFYEHAGWSYDPASETSEQGRERCARELAEAEEQMVRRGWYVRVLDDPDVMDDDVDSIGLVARGECVNLFVDLHNEQGRRIASIGGVTVPFDDDPYIRVLAAELAAELLATHQECHARTTCGGCGNAWCGECDPAPSALCHWCHGRGKSTAPMTAADEYA